MKKGKGSRKEGKGRLLRRNVGASRPFTFPRSLLPPARERAGFTLLEAAVVMALLTIIAGILLANSPALNQRIALQRSAQSLALGLRRAQSMALAVRQVQGPTGVLVPPAFGIYVTRADPTRYLVFADLRVGGVNDRRYRPGDDLVIETVTFPAGVALSDLRSEIDTSNTAQDALSVAFTVPEANMSLSNDSAPVGASARMTLSSPALTYIRGVTVRVSGQISTR